MWCVCAVYISSLPQHPFRWSADKVMVVSQATGIKTDAELQNMVSNGCAKSSCAAQSRRNRGAFSEIALQFGRVFLEGAPGVVLKREAAILRSEC